MPVTVHCSQCSADLHVDEGFKGGVCRCSSCGTLLAVPADDPAASNGDGDRRRRKRPPNPNADPSLHRDNQHELKQRTGVFPALTELIGSSSGLQGVRQQPPAPPIHPSESALGLSPPSPLAAMAPTFDLPASPSLDGPPAQPPQPPATQPPANRTPEPFHTSPPVAHEPRWKLGLAILAAMLLLALVIWATNAHFSSFTPAPAPKVPPGPVPAPTAPSAPTLTPEPPAPEAPATLPTASAPAPSPIATPVPETLPAATIPVPTTAPDPTAPAAPDPAATLPAPTLPTTLPDLPPQPPAP